MIKWFIKSGMFMQVTIFIVIAIALWMPAFVHPLAPVRSATDGPIYSYIAGWMYYFPIQGVALALILVIAQAIIMFSICQSNGFFGRSNFLPAIIILIAYSWNSSYLTLHAVLFSGVLLMIGTQAILMVFGHHGPYKQVFTVAFSFAVAALFFIPLVYFILFIWFAFIAYRISTWREYSISILAFLAPFVYYASWLFWFDEFAKGMTEFLKPLFRLALPTHISVSQIIWLAATAFVFMILMTMVLNVMNDKTINLRRRAWVFFNFGFIAFIAVILSGFPILQANYLFAIPAAFFFTGSLTFFKRTFWIETILITLFALFISLRLYEAII